MKSRILKFLFFLIVLFSPFFVLNFFYIKAEYEHGDSDIRKFKNVPNGIELANLGSSHGKYAFDYANHPEIKTFNFALPMQSLDLDSRITKQFISKMKENSVLLIIVSWFEVDAIPTKENFELREKKYYQFLDRNLLPDYEFSKYIVLKYFPSLKAKNPLATIWNNLLLKKSDATLSKSFADIAAEDKISQSREAAEGIFRSFSRKSDEGLHYNSALLFEIIETCKEHKVRPVIITTPVTDTVVSFFPEQKDLTENIQNLKNCVANKYQDVLWLDFSLDSNLTGRYDLFFDASHMNKQGALFFTDKVIQILIDKGLFSK